MWKHTGGGCMLGTQDTYPCDDTYVDSETGDTLELRCTVDAHFAMPFVASSKEGLLGLPGVILAADAPEATIAAVTHLVGVPVGEPEEDDLLH